LTDRIVASRAVVTDFQIQQARRIVFGDFAADTGQRFAGGAPELGSQAACLGDQLID
jgi:hypothetical protein